MASIRIHHRIGLDFVALGLILLCLAYWWLDNLAHEIIGTAFFALIILHNVFNRLWYRVTTQKRPELPSIYNLVIILGLVSSVTILLVTSLLISRDLFTFSSLGGAFTIRAIHMFSGYWLLFIVALHLGTRWPVILQAARSRFGLRTQGMVWIFISRLLAVAIVVAGMASSLEMAFGSKLMLRFTLDMWDFNESTMRFFLNYAAIVGMYAVVSYYAFKWLHSRRRRKLSA